jgi:hypothetical protein
VLRLAAPDGAWRDAPMDDLRNGRYRWRGALAAAGVHGLAALVGVKSLGLSRGSPMVVAVEAGARADAARCSTSGPGLVGGTLGRALAVRIALRDAFGNALPAARAASVNVSVAAGGDAAAVALEASAGGPAVAVAMYTRDAPGGVLLEVLVPPPPPSY